MTSTNTINKHIKRCVMILSYALNSLVNEQGSSYTHNFCIIATGDTTKPLGFTDIVTIRLGEHRIIILVRENGIWLVKTDLLEYQPSIPITTTYTQVPLYPIKDCDWFCDIVQEALTELLSIGGTDIHDIYFSLNTNMKAIRINERFDINTAPQTYRSVGIYNA